MSHVTRTELARDGPQHGRVGAAGVSVLPRDALTPKYSRRLVVPVPFTRPAPVTARRARLPQETSRGPRPIKAIARRGRRLPDITSEPAVQASTPCASVRGEVGHATYSAVRQLHHRRALVRTRPTMPSHRTGVHDDSGSQGQGRPHHRCVDRASAPPPRAPSRGTAASSSSTTTRAAAPAESGRRRVRSAGRNGGTASAATSCRPRTSSASPRRRSRRMGESTC